MNIRLLNKKDTKKLEAYLGLYKSECMFICSNLSVAGIEYKGADIQGEYFGYFRYNPLELTEQLDGVIVHYWNGNVMMHASDQTILKQLVIHLKNNITRPIAGILGSNIQAEYVIQNLGLSNANFSINRKEWLYKINIANLNEVNFPKKLDVVSAKEVSKDLLIRWMQAYDVEALGASKDSNLEKRAIEKVNRLLKNDCCILLSKGKPVSLCAFNARLEDMVQVGPVWTPPEQRNKGFAKLLLTFALFQEKIKGTKEAILFTYNPAAIKVYLSIGFKKIGDYRLALFSKNPINLKDTEFTASPIASDIEFLTQKINEETNDFGVASPFAFFIRNEDNCIIAGCNGSVIFGSIYTDQLWV
ncbi:MAG: GNAT family N-acetyltransferase, partial [Gammaproteobacteria bacterium]